MGDKRFKISDFSFNLIIAQSLPPLWDHVLSYFVDVGTGQTSTDVDRTMINSQQFMEVIKQEYRRREQWDSENLAIRVTTYVGLPIHEPTLANLILIGLPRHLVACSKNIKRVLQGVQET